MRTYLASLALMTTLTSQAVADVEGTMSCKVKSQNIMQIEEGIPAEFSHVKDQFQVGDVLILKYLAEENPEGNASGFSFTITDQIRDKLVYSAIPSNGNEDLKIWKRGALGVGASGYFDKIFLGGDKIYLTSMAWGNAWFKRYYKNDWEGLVVDQDGFTQTGGLRTSAYSLDCRHTEDSLDSFIAKMKSKAWN